jgi:hypothetical protein
VTYPLVETIERIIMDEKKGPEQAKRGAANRAIGDRSASNQIGAKSREVAKDIQEIGEIAMDAAQEKLGQLRDSATLVASVSAARPDRVVPLTPTVFHNDIRATRRAHCNIQAETPRR